MTESLQEMKTEDCAHTDVRVLRKIEESDTRLTVNTTTLLGLLTTDRVERNSHGKHTRSVLLIRRDDTDLVLVDNLQFHVVLSVHEAMPMPELVDALQEKYMEYQYNDDALKRTKTAVLGHGATEEELASDCAHPLYRIAQCNNAQWQLYQARLDDDGDESMQPVSCLPCIRGAEAFHVNRRSPIYNKLCSGRSGTKKCPVQRQWRLSFDNHLAAQYVIEKLQRVLYIRRQPCEVRVLCWDGDHKVSFLDYQRDSVQRYLLDQLPRFRSEYDALSWSFSQSVLLPPGSFIHRGSMERAPPCQVDWPTLWREGRPCKDRVALNMLDFEPVVLGETQCRVVDFAARIQSVATDGRSVAATAAHKSQLAASAERSVEKTEQQLALEQKREQQYAIRTSRPKQPVPGQVKRLAQAPLLFTGYVKRPRVEEATETS